MKLSEPMSTDVSRDYCKEFIALDSTDPCKSARRKLMDFSAQGKDYVIIRRIEGEAIIFYLFHCEEVLRYLDPHWREYPLGKLLHLSERVPSPTITEQGTPVLGAVVVHGDKALGFVSCSTRFVACDLTDTVDRLSHRLLETPGGYVIIPRIKGEEKTYFLIESQAVWEHLIDHYRPLQENLTLEALLNLGEVEPSPTITEHGTPFFGAIVVRDDTPLGFIPRTEFKGLNEFAYPIANVNNYISETLKCLREYAESGTVTNVGDRFIGRPDSRWESAYNFLLEFKHDKGYYSIWWLHLWNFLQFSRLNHCCAYVFFRYLHQIWCFKRTIILPIHSNRYLPSPEEDEDRARLKDLLEESRKKAKSVDETVPQTRFLTARTPDRIALNGRTYVAIQVTGVLEPFNDDYSTDDETNDNLFCKLTIDVHAPGLTSIDSASLTLQVPARSNSKELFFSFTADQPGKQQIDVMAWNRSALVAGLTLETVVNEDKIAGELKLKDDKSGLVAGLTQVSVIDENERAGELKLKDDKSGLVAGLTRENVVNENKIAGNHKVENDESAQVIGLTQESVFNENEGAGNRSNFEDGETHIEAHDEICMREPEGGEYTLDVTLEQNPSRYRFQLRSDQRDVWPPMYSEPSGCNQQQLYEAMLATLNAHARNLYNLSVKDQHTWLRSMGTLLSEQLIPDNLRALLVEHRAQIRVLNIISDADSTPWELLFLNDPTSTNGDFLSASATVARWRYGARPSIVLPHRDKVVVFPAGAPRKAQDEITVLTELFGNSTTIDNITSLNELLESGSFDLLHFASHNVLVPGARGGAYVPFGKQRWDLTYMYAIPQNNFRARAPLIFMNACTTSGATPLYAAITSWADRFLKCGSGAFIGTLWEVRDDSAKLFSDTFYTNLRQGATLGDAMRTARAALRVKDPGDPTPFAYTLYGSPLARLK